MDLFTVITFTDTPSRYFPYHDGRCSGVNGGLTFENQQALGVSQPAA